MGPSQACASRGLGHHRAIVSTEALHSKPEHPVELATDVTDRSMEERRHIAGGGSALTTTSREHQRLAAAVHRVRSKSHA